MNQDKATAGKRAVSGKTGGDPTNGTEGPVRSLESVGWYGCALPPTHTK